MTFEGTNEWVAYWHAVLYVSRFTLRMHKAQPQHSHRHVAGLQRLLRHHPHVPLVCHLQQARVSEYYVRVCLAESIHSLLVMRCQTNLNLEHGKRFKPIWGNSQFHNYQVYHNTQENRRFFLYRRCHNTMYGNRH